MTAGVLVVARSARTSRPFSDEPVKMTLSTPPAIASRAAVDALGQNGEKRGIEPGLARESSEKKRDIPRARRGLEQDRVARDERVERMNRREKERIISRTDDKHEAEWLALHFKGEAAQPERTPAFSGATRREHPRSAFFQPATGVGQREDFGNELLRRRPIAHRGGGDGERLLCSRRADGEVRARFAAAARSARNAQRV